MQLVEDLRRMTAVAEAQYEIDGITFWSDEDLEKLIERHVCARLIQAEIQLIPSRTSEAALVFVDGRAPIAGTLDTESAAVVSWTGRPIPGTATIHDDGRVEFTDNQVTAVPVISGLCYDLNSAAAAVLTDWASALKLGYDIKSGDASLPRSQRHAMLLEQAEAFRARAVVGTGQMGRSDVRPARSGSSRTDAVLKSFDRLGRPG
jgi:hypothetical protein